MAYEKIGALIRRRRQPAFLSRGVHRVLLRPPPWEADVVLRQPELFYQQL